MVLFSKTAVTFRKRQYLQPNSAMNTSPCRHLHEQDDNLIKEARNSPQLSNCVAFIDADAVGRRKLTSQKPKKYSIPT